MNLGFGVVEMIGGFIANSQALKADALDFACCRLTDPASGPPPSPKLIGLLPQAASASAVAKAKRMGKTQGDTPNYGLRKNISGPENDPCRGRWAIGGWIFLPRRVGSAPNVRFGSKAGIEILVRRSPPRHA